MRALNSLAVSAIILVAFSGTLATARPAADDHNTIVITFKDGHRESLAVAEIARLDFKSPSVIIYKDGHHEKINAAEIVRIDFDSPDATATLPGRAHFLGKWEVGDGNSGSLGEEVRVRWDDGWRDVICKVGDRHEKFAFAPGSPLDDKAANVTAARKIEAKKSEPKQ